MQSASVCGHTVAVQQLLNSVAANAVAAAVVVVPDLIMCRIRMVPGSVSLLAGNTLVSGGGFRDAAGSQAQLKSPTALSLTADGTVLFVADAGNKAIRTVYVDDSALGEWLQTWARSPCLPYTAYPQPQLVLLCIDCSRGVVLVLEGRPGRALSLMHAVSCVVVCRHCKHRYPAGRYPVRRGVHQQLQRGKHIGCDHRHPASARAWPSVSVPPQSHGG